MIDAPRDEADDLDELERELAYKQMYLQAEGSLLATGKPQVGWNAKATRKRRAKNRVARQSRRKNRS